MGLLSRLFGPPVRRDPVAVIIEAIRQIKLGVYWRLSKKYEAAKLGKEGYTLAYAVTYELFMDAEGASSLRDYVANHADMISREANEALQDREIYRAVSVALAGEIMARAGATGDIAASECVVEHASRRGIVIANIAQEWGWGSNSISRLYRYATQFRRASA